RSNAASRRAARSTGCPGVGGGPLDPCCESTSKSNERSPITPEADETALSVASQIGQRPSSRAISGASARTRIRQPGQLRWGEDITRLRARAVRPRGARTFFVAVAMANRLSALSNEVFARKARRAGLTGRTNNIAHSDLWTRNFGAANHRRRAALPRDAAFL